MSHRTQITLSDEQYTRLRAESQRSGLGLSELVRRAVESTYGCHNREELLDALEASFGSWEGREEDGAAYVEGRRRGIAQRLAGP
jgi:hypothetical protein